MCPARAPYEAPPHVRAFFEALRQVQTSIIAPALLEKIQLAELRGGNVRGWKKHLHHTKFKDVKTGFEFDAWPNDLETFATADSVAVGLYVTGDAFKPRALHGPLLARLRADPTATLLGDLGFTLSDAHDQNAADRTTGTWVALQRLPLRNYDPEVGAECGRRLGRLMEIVRPVLLKLLELRAPGLLKQSR